MAVATKYSPEIILYSRENRRTLAIRAVNLACCAIEAAAALEDLPRLDDAGSALATHSGALNVLVVAGTVTRENAGFVKAAYDEMPSPKKSIAFGVCTISGGPYWDSYAVLPGISGLFDVDVHLPGCPPHPEDLKRALDELALATP